MNSDWMKGYIVGKALAKSMPYRAVEKDILDNTWPIQFNTLAVANNSTKVIVEGTQIVKISDLTLDKEEAKGLTASATFDGEVAPLVGAGTMDFDIGSIVMFGTNFSDAEFGIVSVTSTQASEDMYGFSFPAAGLYTILPVKDGEPVNATIALKQGVAPKYFFDSFPIDLKFTPAYLGQFMSLESAPLVLEDGSQNGTYMKISNMTPTLEELSAMNFSEAAASCIDGVVGEVDSGPATASWDPTGQFVKLDGASIIIVYEAKTINTTPFDVDTPATVTLTPGIWLTDGYTFAMVFVIASMIQGSTNDSCADDYMRIVYGSAEDVEKTLEEYGEVV